MLANNRRFNASGGVVSAEIEKITSSFALAQALPIPRLHAKLRDDVGNAGTVRA